MEVRLAVVSDYATIDKLEKLSVNGIFNVIFAESAPTVHPGMFLVFQLEFDTLETGETRDIAVSLVDADDKILLALMGQINIATPADGVPALVNQILRLGPTLYERFGRYEFRIVIGDYPTIIIPITVARVHPSKQTGV